MFTPEEAREMADWIARKLGYSGVASDIRDLATQVERLEARQKLLRDALLVIDRRAYNEEPCEELEDAQRDLRHIHACASAALKETE